MWESQLDAFAGWRVLTPSFPGFDGQPTLAESTVEGYAGHVLSEMDRSGVADAVIGGLSMGGYVALALQRLARERVTGLVLADTRAAADTPAGVDGRRRMLSLLARDGVPAVSAEMVPKLLGQTTRTSRPGIVARVAGLIAGQGRDGVAGAIEAMMARPDSTPRLGEIRVPALVVVGEEDTLTPPAEAELLRNGIPGARLITIPTAGHLANMEVPEAFNDAVRQFLQSVR
jgi:3-oxoadipate enol-lactonase